MTGTVRTIGDLWLRSRRERPALSSALLVLIPIVYLGNTLVALATRAVVDSASIEHSAGEFSSPRGYPELPWL